jgi:hypothetical protein
MKLSSKTLVPNWFLGFSVAVVLSLVVALVGVVVVAHQRVGAANAETEQVSTAAEIDGETARQVAARAAGAAAAKATRQRKAAAARAAKQKTTAVQAATRKANAKAAKEKTAAVKAARKKATKAAVAKAAAATAAAAAAEAAARHTITGQVTVSDVNGSLVTQVGGYPGEPVSDLTGAQLMHLNRLLGTLKTGETYPCPQGAGGRYGDVVAGGQVVVQDGERNTLGTSTLTGGLVNTRGCTFDFQVEVSDSDFYGLTVAHRDELSYSRKDMTGNQWQVVVTL